MGCVCIFTLCVCVCVCARARVCVQPCVCVCVYMCHLLSFVSGARCGNAEPPSECLSARVSMCVCLHICPTQGGSRC